MFSQMTSETAALQHGGFFFFGGEPAVEFPVTVNTDEWRYSEPQRRTLSVRPVRRSERDLTGLLTPDHRRSMLTATSQSNGNGQNSIPHRI